MRNVLRSCVVFAVMGTVVLGLPLKSALAATDMTISQKILPVTFVYVGKNHAIVDTWSNVSKEDDAYVLKFFDASQKSELPLADDLMANYIGQKIEQKQIDRNEAVQFKKENGVMIQTITAT